MEYRKIEDLMSHWDTEVQAQMSSFKELTESLNHTDANINATAQRLRGINENYLNIKQQVGQVESLLKSVTSHQELLQGQLKSIITEASKMLNSSSGSSSSLPGSSTAAFGSTAGGVNISATSGGSVTPQAAGSINPSSPRSVGSAQPAMGADSAQGELWSLQRIEQLSAQLRRVEKEVSEISGVLQQVVSGNKDSAHASSTTSQASSAGSAAGAPQGFATVPGLMNLLRLQQQSVDMMKAQAEGMQRMFK